MKRYLLLIIGFGVIICMAGCFTTPEAVQPASSLPTQEATASPSVSPLSGSAAEPTKERDQAIALKEKAVEYGLNELLVSDWAPASEAFLAGGASFGKDNDASRVAYEKAIGLFKALIEKGLPLVVDARMTQAKEMRATGVGAMADTLFADQLLIADAALASAETKKQAQELEGAIAEYTRARDLYAILYKKAQAEQLRAKIKETGYAQFDEENFILAESKFAAIDGLFDKNNAQAIALADEALLRYRQVLSKGLDFHVAEARADSETSKELAKDIKADVAVPDAYAKASELYDQAVAAENNGDMEKALDLYAEAKGVYDEAYEAAKVKKEKAEAAIKSVNEDAKLSEQKAQDAETYMNAIEGE